MTISQDADGGNTQTVKHDGLYLCTEAGLFGLAAGSRGGQYSALLKGREMFGATPLTTAATLPDGSAATVPTKIYRIFQDLRPTVGARGLPPDLSSESKKDIERWGTFAQSWITWQEVKAIDWDEEAVDGRPRFYTRAEDGGLVLRGKAAPREGDVIEEGRTWEDRGNVWKVERISRREVLEKNGEWRLLFDLFDLMARLAQDYGDELVRLVAWFDR